MKNVIPQEQKLLKPESSFWKHVLNLLSVILFVVVFINWRAGEDIGNAAYLISIAYAGMLAIYCAEKEYERWHGYHRMNGGGETYVLVWTLVLAVLFVSKSFFGSKYDIPPYLIALYAVMLAVFAITRKSKLQYEHRQWHLNQMKKE